MKSPDVKVQDVKSQATILGLLIGSIIILVSVSYLVYDLIYKVGENKNTIAIGSLVFKDSIQFSKQILYIVFFGAISVMSFLQLFKDIFPIQRFYNRNAFDKWLNVSDKNSRRKLRESIVRLAMAGSQRELFKLKADQIANQINIATQVALDNPTLNKTILKNLARQRTSDVNTMIKYLKMNKKERLQSEDIEDDFIQARNRVENILQRNIDTLQVLLVSGWNRTMRFYSLIITGISILIIVESIDFNILGRSSYTIAAAILFAIVISHFSNILRDIVTLIQTQKLKD